MHASDRALMCVMIGRHTNAEQPLGGFRDRWFQRPRLQAHPLGQPIGDDAQSSEPAERLIVGRNDVPRARRVDVFSTISSIAAS